MQDEDTIATEGQAIEDFLTTRAWPIIRDKFTNTIIDLQSVMNISGTTDQEISREMYARRLAVTYLKALLAEIEGIAQQHQGNKPTKSNEEDNITIQI